MSERVSQGIDRPLAHFEEKADGMCDFFVIRFGREWIF